MSEPRFFARSQGLNAGEIATLTGALARPGASLERRVMGIATLDYACPGDLVFLQNPKHAVLFASTRAGICLTTERFARDAPADVTVLVTPKPYEAFIAATQALYPGAMRPSSLFEASGVAPGAFVHPSARLESGVTVDPAAVIGPRAEIGAGTIVGAAAVIGPDVRIGRDCAIGPSATIVHALIGNGVIIHAGARIGQDGFGFRPGAAGYLKIPQVGRVIIQNDVEIGANSCIDRGAIRDTVIGEGTKIDNLVHIGHNCVVGRHCVMAAYTGISGSVTVGDHVKTAGRVGIIDNVTIGEGAVLTAAAAILSSVPPGETWGGFPGKPWRQWLRGVAALDRLGRRSSHGKPAAAENNE